MAHHRVKLIGKRMNEHEFRLIEIMQSEPERKNNFKKGN